VSSRQPLLILALLAIGLSPWAGLSAGEAGDHFQVTTIAPGLLLISTDQGSYCNNSLAFTGEDGLLLVDTHHGADAEAFEELIAGLGFGDPRYIISTHRHQASFPDIAVTDSLEITFNGERIRLVSIGGSHDDNEIMVHFTGCGVAHISSVVNGFNFPSVDSDGDVLMFESMTRRLMVLLPEDTRLVSGHHGKARGFDDLGTWDELPAYADMMKATIEIVEKALADSLITEEMQHAGVLDEYEEYAGSYVDTDGWIEYVVDALTVPKETRSDICKPVYAAWQENGATAAVDRYRELLSTHEDEYDFNEYVLMSIGAKLYTREMYDDALVFLLACLELYPEAEYAYYTHYLAARSYQKLDDSGKATEHGRESIRLNPEFTGAAALIEELAEGSNG
jgi:glyoxylase-like metal-dependent hydrolase (beta-lactamase superfamily II)